MDVNDGAQRIAEILGGGRGVLDDMVAIEHDNATERAHVESIFWSNELFYCSEYGDEVRAGDCIGGDLCGMCSVCEWRSYFLSGARKQEQKRVAAVEMIRGKKDRGGGHAKKTRISKGNRSPENAKHEGNNSRSGEIKTTLRRGVDVSKYGQLINNDSKGAAGRALGTEDKVSFGKQILYVGVGAVKRYGLEDAGFVRFWTDADTNTNVCEVALEFLSEHKEGSFKLSRVHTSSENLPAFKVSSAGLRRALIGCGYDVKEVTGHCEIVGSSIERDRVWLIMEILS